MLNQCHFIGRVGRDPEIRETKSKAKVANFTLAVDDSYKDKQGNTQKVTEWVTCVTFSGLAGVVERYVKKGDLVYVSGRMQTRKWQGQDGADRYSTEINVSELKMLGGKKQAEPKSHGAPQREEPQSSFDDQIPF